MTSCAKCGAPLAPDAQFCSKCGTPVAIAPPADVPPVTVPPPAAVPPAAVPPPVTLPPPVDTVRPAAPAKRSTWWIVPAVIVALVLLAWLLLAGLPFGRDKQVVATATTETIAEGTAPAPPAPSGTVVEVDTAEPPFLTETAPPPPLTTTQPPVTQTQPPPVVIEQPRTAPPPATPPVSRPIPRPAPPVQIPAPPVQTPAPRPQPQPEPAPREDAEISEAEATSVLRGHLGSSNPYDVPANCLQFRSAGYRNVGYTFAVWDTCVSGGGTRMLGRWRVDSKTREVFRQREDGRYLRP
jgi:zinc-ribbon domain